MNNITDIWQLYEKGKDFLDQLNLVNNTTQNYRFYEGDHWNGLKSGGEKMPIVEIIKPVVDFKTTVLTQNSLQAVYRPMNYSLQGQAYEESQQICSSLGQYFDEYWELNKMDSAVYDVIKDSLITGDSYMYLYYEDSNKRENGVAIDGQVRQEMVSNTNIMFGDENQCDIQKQPYILLLFRRTVEQVKKKAKDNGIAAKDIRRIVPDDDRDQATGYTEEVKNDSKCLCIMKLWKENGTVHIMESTKTVVYRKDEDLKLTRYPIASYVWENKHGLCRGVSDVNKYIPNQIWVNRLEAYRLIATKMSAFPKLVYSSGVVNKDQIDAVGVALEVEETDISKAMEQVGYINPAPMTSDAKHVLDELMRYTKEAAGASDIALGNDKLDNYSAVLALQEAAKAPLSQQTERFKMFIEDIAYILYDMWRNYFTEGLHIRIDDALVVVPKDMLEKMRINIRVDVTPTSPFNKISEQQKADNLMMNKMITFEEYAMLVADDDPIKPRIMSIVEARQMAQQTIEQQALDQAATENIELQSQLQEAEANTAQAMNDAYTQAAIDTAAAKE